MYRAIYALFFSMIAILAVGGMTAAATKAFGDLDQATGYMSRDRVEERPTVLLAAL